MAKARKYEQITCPVCQGKTSKVILVASNAKVYQCDSAACRGRRLTAYNNGNIGYTRGPVPAQPTKSGDSAYRGDNTGEITIVDKPGDEDMVSRMSNLNRQDITGSVLKDLEDAADDYIRAVTGSSDSSGYADSSEGEVHSYGRWHGSLTHHNPNTYPVGFRPAGSHGEDGVFTVEAEDVIDGECEHTIPPVVEVPTEMYREWHDLAKASNAEWIAHLVGEKLDDGSYRIKSYHFPPQIGSGGFVDVPADYTPKRGVIGAVHSHVNMAVFFSETDIQHSNWPVEIVVNRKAEYKAMVRWKMACGCWSKSYTKIKLALERRTSQIVDQLKLAYAAGQELRAKMLAESEVNNPVGFVPVHRYGLISARNFNEVKPSKKERKRQHRLAKLASQQSIATETATQTGPFESLCPDCGHAHSICEYVAGDFVGYRGWRLCNERIETKEGVTTMIKWCSCTGPIPVQSVSMTEQEAQLAVAAAAEQEGIASMSEAKEEAKDNADSEQLIMGVWDIL